MKNYLHLPIGLLRMAFVAFAILFIVTGCEKDEVETTSPLETSYTESAIEKNFFNYFFLEKSNEKISQSNDKQEDVLIRESLEAVRKDNQKHKNVENAAHQIGYPIWSKSTVEETNFGNTIVFTPFAFTHGEKVNAILFSIKDKTDGFKFKLVTEEDLEEAKAKGMDDHEGYFDLFRTFDFSLFGKSSRFIPPNNSEPEKAKIRTDCTQIVVSICAKISHNLTEEEKAETRGSCEREDGSIGVWTTVVANCCCGSGIGGTIGTDGGIFSGLGGSKGNISVTTNTLPPVPGVDPDEDSESDYCSNGQQDGQETGVDCGGACAPCEDNVSMIEKLSLTPDEEDCLLASKMSIIIDDMLKNNSLTDVCDPSKSTADIIKEAISNMAASGDCSKEGFFNELDGGSYFIEDASFTNCSQLKCVWDNLSENNSLFCSTAGNFMDTPQFNLKLKASTSVLGDAQTSSPDENGTITITFNSLFNCTGSGEHQIDVAATILHEVIHAEMYRQCLEANLDCKNPNSYAEIWNYQLKLKLGEPPYQLAQHEIMAEKYVMEIAKALQEMFGIQYDIDYFMAAAWDGLERYGEALGSLNGHTKEYYQNLSSQFQNSFPPSCN